MVISGGQFKPDALKPKEVVSLLLDDAEMECKFIQKQAEKKADDQKKRRERKRKQPDASLQVDAIPFLSLKIKRQFVWALFYDNEIIPQKTLELTHLAKRSGLRDRL